MSETVKTTKEYNLSLAEDEINTILQVLDNNVVHRVARPLIDKIISQANGPMNNPLPEPAGDREELPELDRKTELP